MITALVSSLIFVATLALIFSEKIDRAIVAIAGAVVMVGAVKSLGF
jgi:hypothetical protein